MTDKETVKISQEDFVKEMMRFKDDTALEITKMLFNENYSLPTAVFGLVSLVRSLIDTYGDGNQALYEEAVHFLKLKEEDLASMSSDIDDAEDIVREQE